jgi:hypothetical protein
MYRLQRPRAAEFRAFDWHVQVDMEGATLPTEECMLSVKGTATEHGVVTSLLQWRPATAALEILTLIFAA